jgi:hypothetical protein
MFGFCHSAKVDAKSKIRARVEHVFAEQKDRAWPRSARSWPAPSRSAPAATLKICTFVGDD